jgi:hypothetical protein
MKVTNTIEAKIFLGLREGYTNIYKDKSDVYSFLSEYCTQNNLAVSVTPTKYIYVDGEEDGVIIGLINYPRFPSTKEEIKKIALDLGQKLIENFYQYRSTIIINSLNESDGSTIMLENEYMNNV